MKRIKLITIALAILVSFSLQAQQWKIVTGNHKVVSKDREIGSFSGIKVSSGIDIYLKQGNKETLTVEADENLQEYIITEVRNGVLNIYTDVNIRDAEMKKAYVTMREINSVRTSSAGNVTGETPVKSDNLELSTSSAGNIKLEVDVKDLKLNISSAGDIKLTGKADILDADLSSAGDLNAYELQVREAEVNVSSAGSADVNVSERITARASSAGDINYRGNPKYVDAHSSSAGGIHKR